MNVYVLEVNPRASRTVPFVAKATGVPVAKIAAKVMTGMTLAELGVTEEPIPVACVDQGECLSVPQVRGRRHCAGSGNAQHGRSDGSQRTVLHRLCQGPAGGRRRLAGTREDLHQRFCPAQGPCGATGATAGGSRISN